MKNYYVNVKSSAPVGSGIKYQRPIVSQTTQYRVGDTGWAYNNGFIDYSNDPVNPEYYQELDYSNTTNFWFTLKHNNAFGNKFRYTNSLGENQDPNGRIAGITFSGAVQSYIIDHLTGFAFMPLDTGGNLTWNQTIDRITTERNASFQGFNDWIPPFINLMSTSFNAHFNGQNPFGTTVFYAGCTVGGITGNSWRLLSNGIVATTKGTATNGILCLCRQVY
jgi:hypothetical protein